jgi:DNA polymerase III delta prime subunit
LNRCKDTSLILSMSQSLPQKYKPIWIRDFNLAPDLDKAIRTFIEIGDLNLMFMGEPNAGKSTFLYAVIREYYGTEHIPDNNLMMISNLKEQGIGFFRNEMKTFCQTRSAIFGKKKLVVIDDFDIINEQSQHIFRNCIDKYSQNVNFLCACTNIHKVMECIQSRLHIIGFPSPNTTQIRTLMERITTDLSLRITDETKEYIIQLSGGSIRNVINNLEKIMLYDAETTDLELCQKLCTNISLQKFDTYMESFRLDYNLTTSVAILYEIYDHGYSVIDILDFFFSYIKTTTTLSEDEKYRLLPIICKYIAIFNEIHEDVVELALMTSDIGNLRFSYDPPRREPTVPFPTLPYTE